MYNKNKKLWIMSLFLILSGCKKENLSNHETSTISNESSFNSSSSSNFISSSNSITSSVFSSNSSIHSNSGNIVSSNSSSSEESSFSMSSTSSSSSEENLNYYTYRFFNAEDEVIKEDTILEGEAVIPPEENPEKPSTTQYTYQFLKWSIDDFQHIHSDLDIYPIYSELVNQYTFRFLNYDDSLLKEGIADYGTPIEAPNNPTYTDDDFIYVFKGWDKEFSILTENITIKAEYEIFKTYTYRFYDANGNVLKEERVLEGEAIIPPEIPEKADTDEFSYSFLKWSVEDFSSIHENLDIYPIYSNVVKQYTYRFLNYDDSVLKEVTANYGSSIEYPENPIYSDNSYTYTFSHWDSEATILVQNLDIKAIYNQESEPQAQALHLLRSALENNQIITLDAVLEGKIPLQVQFQFSIQQEILNAMLQHQVSSIEDVLQAIQLKAIITYQEEQFLLEITPTNSYVSAYDKVFSLPLLKTYQTLTEVLPKDVFDLVTFLDNFFTQEPVIKTLQVNLTSTGATLTTCIENTYAESTNENTTLPFYGNDFTCSATFSKINHCYQMDTVDMRIQYEKIVATKTNQMINFTIDKMSSLNWLDNLLCFAQPISKTAQLKDFHISGTLQLKAVGFYTASVGFDMKLSIDEQQKVQAFFELKIKKDLMSQIFVADTTTLLYLDEAQDKIYVNRSYKKLFGSAIVEKKTWTTAEFEANIAENIFYILNASDTVKKNADAQATINGKELVKSIDKDENNTTLTLTLSKDAIQLIKEGSNLSVTKDIIIAISCNADGYLTSLSLTGGVAMSGLELEVSTENLILSDINTPLNVATLIENALKAGTIADK